MKLKLKNANLLGIKLFLECCEGTDSSHVLEIVDDQLMVKAMPSGKEFIKFTSTNLEHIGEIDLGGRLLKIPLQKVSRLIQKIDVFLGRKNTDNVFLDIEAEEDTDTENALVAKKIKICHKSQTATMGAAEPMFVHYMPREVWDKFSDVTTHTSRFKITVDDIKDIAKLVKTEVSDKSKGINTCRLVLSKNHPPVIKSHKDDAWDIVLSDDYSHTPDVTLYATLPLKALSEMKFMEYTVYVVNSGMPSMVAVHDNDNKVLFGYAEYNPQA